MPKLKVSDIEEGMTVKCTNMFNLSYTVEKIQSNGKFTLSHWDGESEVMRGGKMVKDIFYYKDVSIKQITKIVN